MPRKRNPVTDMPVGAIETAPPETTETLLSETRLETSPDMPLAIHELTTRNIHPLVPELEIIGG